MKSSKCSNSEGGVSFKHTNYIAQRRGYTWISQ